MKPIRHEFEQKVDAMMRITEHGWTQVLAIARQYPSSIDPTTHKMRAVNYLANEIETTLGKSERLCKQSIRLCDELPLEQAADRSMIAQFEGFRHSLANYAWEQAWEWLERDGDSAIDFITRDPALAKSRACQYLITVSAVQAKKHGSFDPYTIFPEDMAPMLKAAGGAEHFIHFALAAALAFVFVDAFCLMSGEPREQYFRFADKTEQEILSKGRHLFVAPFDSQLQLLVNATQEGLQALVDMRDGLSARRLEMAQRARKHVDEVESAREVAEREARNLRKRLAATEAREAEGRRRIQILSHELDKRSKKDKQHQPASEELASTHAQLRTANALIDKSNEEKNRLSSEVERLRDFVQLLLAAKDDAADDPAPTTESSDPKDWKVVFVGGHERVHAKLRKVMPASVFLHPDRVQFDRSILDNCHAVLFSVSYCSHALATKVFNVARRRAIPIGYTDHVNVDMILSDVSRTLGDISRG